MRRVYADGSEMEPSGTMTAMSTHDAHAPLATATQPNVQRALPQGLPTAIELFTFAAGAEWRMRTLRARVEERATTASGISRVDTEILLARPRLRVTTIRREGTGAGSYDLWATDGVAVEQFSSATRTRTRRLVRRAPEGLDDQDLPPAAGIDASIGALPTKSWAATVLRPGNFCATVLATGVLGVVEATTVAGRAALLVASAAPRAVGLEGDRADFRCEVAFDRITGAILAVEELRGERVVRSAVVTTFSVDESIPESALDLEIPSDAVGIY